MKHFLVPEGMCDTRSISLSMESSPPKHAADRHHENARRLRTNMNVIEPHGQEM